MSIQSYPRTIVQNTGNGELTQNGLCLMIYNSTTNKYEAATASTFGGGGGGGDATAANQTTQITEAQTTNGYLVSPNLVSVGNLLESNNAVSVANLLESASSVSVANLLETTGGTSVADVCEVIDTKTTKIQKYSQWNTLTSIVYYNASSTNTFTFPAPAVKIVFNSANVEVTGLTDDLGNNVLSDYFIASGATLLANTGSEIISNGNSANDLFKDITVVGAAHFTVYCLITPYVTP